jgi:hypothetical protein
MARRSRDGDREYMKRYRASSPKARAYDRKQVRAWTTAMRRLREAHFEEFRKYYEEERANAGLP